MTAFITRCKDCDTKFEPTQDSIRAGSWRRCPACRAESSKPSRCRECGKSLAGTRDVCLVCMGVGL